MRRITGCSLYVTDLASALRNANAQTFAVACRQSKVSAIWVRLARGNKRDANFEGDRITELASALALNQVELWGWHVPFCANASAAELEGENITHWASDAALAGILIDAEHTPENPRFRGGAREADIYCNILRRHVEAEGMGLALSSHDQPHLHGDFPFASFLAHVVDNCPQVYYRDHDVVERLARSVSDYRSLERGRNFDDRFKPTGNLTIRGDIKLSSTKACYNSAVTFMKELKDYSFAAYSFWCLDEAPADAFDFLRDHA